MRGRYLLRVARARSLGTSHALPVTMQAHSHEILGSSAARPVDASAIGFSAASASRERSEDRANDDLARCLAHCARQLGFAIATRRP